MRWIRFSILTKVSAVDVISYELDLIGIEGIEIEDHLPLSDEDKKRMFVDIADDPEVIDDVAVVHFYKDAADCDKDDILKKVDNILSDVGSYMDIGAGSVSVSETEDKDWINNWKEFFKPFRASDHIAISPTWIEDIDDELMRESDDRGVKKLYIDPGVAFGTGSHETTKLCIQALDRYIGGGERMLDIGCGSGILSIAALILGVGYATAIDIDEMAVSVAKENFDVNNIPENSYTLIAGNLLSDDVLIRDIEEKAEGTGYDIVAANILPDVIVPLTAIVPRFIRNGGIYITSGILTERADEVETALKQAGFKDIVKNIMGQWCSFVCRSERR